MLEDLTENCGVEAREELVNDLSVYISSSKHSINNLIEKFGWTRELLLQDSALGQAHCPFNPGHIMPESSLEKHKEICAWKQEGYTKEEINNAVPSSHFFYHKSTSVVPVLIDKKLQSEILKNAASTSGNSTYVMVSGVLATCFISPEIPLERNVPRTMDRVIVEFTPRERLSIYEFVIEKMKKIKKEASVKLEDLQFNLDGKKDNGDSKPKSQLELMAEQRDYKRRRQSYRAKNVHITKKSYTEVMKEVIQNQMDILADGAAEEVNEDRTETSLKGEPSSPQDRSSYRQDSNGKSHSSSRKRFLDHDEERSRESSRSRKHKREKREDREYSHKHHHKHKHKKSKYKH